AQTAARGLAHTGPARPARTAQRSGPPETGRLPERSRRLWAALRAHHPRQGLRLARAARPARKRKALAAPSRGGAGILPGARTRGRRRRRAGAHPPAGTRVAWAAAG